jgi:hypothetical protein
MSRFHHFPFFSILAIKDEGIISKMLVQLRTWNEQNPYLKSINWKSGIEAGIRVTNLLLARKILVLLDKTPEIKALSECIDTTIYLHYHFLQRHLSLFSSANNHLIAELMGLCLVCNHYRFKNSQKQLRYYQQFLQKSYIEQTHEDGFSKEQSVHYHAETLSMMIICFNAIKIKKSDYPLAEQVLDRLYKGINILKKFNEWSCDAPHIGDSDDGQLIYPYADNDFDLYGSIFEDRCTLFGKNNPKIGIRNYLNSGEITMVFPAKEESNNSDYYTELCESSGYCFFYHGDKKLIFDVGELGLAPLSAHGHADALQILLSYKDEPFIVDVATYQYNTKYEKWRKYFRSTKAHNTIFFDSKDQAEQIGRMNWGQNFNSTVEKFETSNEKDICTASNNGFIKQGVGAKHIREVSFDKNLSSFLIKDKVETNVNVEMSFSLHFAPHIVPHLKGNKLLLTGKQGAIELTNSIFKNAVINKGTEESFISGWYSPSFGKMMPTCTLSVSVGLTKDTEISTQIFFK